MPGDANALKMFVPRSAKDARRATFLHHWLNEHEGDLWTFELRLAVSGAIRTIEFALGRLFRVTQ